MKKANIIHAKLLTLSLCLATSVIYQPYANSAPKHAGQNVKTSGKLIKVPLGKQKKLTVQVEKTAHVFFPDLNKPGLQAAFDASTSAFEPIANDYGINLTAFHLVVPQEGFSFKSLTLKKERSMILFFSDAAKLFIDGNVHNISAKSFAIVPKQHIDKLEKIKGFGKELSHIKVFLTSTPYSEIKNKIEIRPFSTDEWTTAISAKKDIESYNVGWTTSFDSPSGSMGTACSEDLLTDIPKKRKEIYAKKTALNKLTQYINENEKNGKYELKLNGTELDVTGFGKIDMSEMLKEAPIEKWAFSMVPPHRHDAAEIYTGYGENIFMKLGENVIKLPKGALVWVPNNIVHGYMALFKEDEEKVSCIPYLFPQGRYSYPGVKYFFFEPSELHSPKYILK